MCTITQKVVALDIAVHDALGMQITNGFGYLGGDVSYRWEGNGALSLPVRLHVCYQVTSFKPFHDDVQALLLHYDIKAFEDIRVL